MQSASTGAGRATERISRQKANRSDSLYIGGLYSGELGSTVVSKMIEGTYYDVVFGW